eukprot:m.276272 g.276272  ORF g.276272 m.276272 type:complete len:524 (+) comp54858_c0_seq29:710-2281(+)
MRVQDLLPSTIQPHQAAVLQAALAASAALAAGAYVVIKIAKRFRKKPVPERPEYHADAIVVGCGVGGAALATTLARMGKKVIVLERSMDEPDRIVGELMQPGGLQAMSNLGLMDALTGTDMVDVFGYMVHREGQTVKLTHPLVDGRQPKGSSFVHGRLISGLRRVMLREPNVTVIEGSATELLENEGGVYGVSYLPRTQEASAKSPKTIGAVQAPLTFIIDGLGSKFRSRMTRSKAQSNSYFTGCILEHVTPVDRNYAEVCLTPVAPVLVYPITPTLHRVLVDIPAPLPSIQDGALAAYFMKNIVPFVPQHIQGPLIERLTATDGDEHHRLRAMPCTFLPAAPVIEKGAILLGDAMNMRHPLTGGGMTVILKDIEMLCQLLKTENIDFSDQEAVMSTVAKFHWQRKWSHAFVVNVLSMALSSLFSGSTRRLRYLRDSCFQYFVTGGECADGPMRLLGVTRPHPWTLVYHFFSVAGRATNVIIRDYPMYLLPWSLLQSALTVATAARIILPLFASELYRPVFRV